MHGTARSGGTDQAVPTPTVGHRLPVRYGLAARLAVAVGIVALAGALLGSSTVLAAASAAGEGARAGAMSGAATAASVTGNAAAIAVGGDHTCAILVSGGVACWGDNSHGQLGNGTTNNSLTPVAVSGISTATAIAADDNHTCAVLASGGVDCWGLNADGELGNGTTNNSLTPVAVSGISTATAIAAGTTTDNVYGGDHTCALLASGSVYCWGYNQYGQLGNGTAGDSSTPVAVVIPEATGIAAGADHSCAVLASGGVACWGFNEFGELGDGYNNYYSEYPQPVTGITTATAIGAGGDHTCAVLSSGGVDCWGYNADGELGNGTVTVDSLTPVAVTGISSATKTAAGEIHSCALLASGSIKCWGANYYGQLGNGTTTYSSTPVAVSGISNVTAIAAGGTHSANGHHTCALLASGGVDCWGDNAAGELGNGTTTNSSTPVAVLGLGGVLPFTDIAGSSFAADILWLYDSGITKGCSATLFCPDDLVTRGQMAAFLDRALHLPSTTTDYFTDDNGTTFEASINRLAASGITAGCTATTFCPTADVTRGQMAAFLDRAFHLPATSTDYFSDDNGTTFEGNINRLAASGITKGCTPTTFCPKADVTRGQMAAFLHRALTAYPVTVVAAGETDVRP